MDKLRFLLFVGSVSILGVGGGCSSSSNGGSASAGGTPGTNPSTGGSSNQGGQSAGGAGQSTQVNVGPPCTPVGVNLPASTTVATASYDMQAVTVSGTDVYYIDHGQGVYRITGGAGTPTQVVPPVTDTSTGGHTMAGGVLQIDDAYVYFAQDESLYRSALANPSPELLVTAANDITQVEIDGSYAYYVVTTGTISRIPLAGGTPDELVPAEASAQGMQLVNDTIYFVNFDLGEVGRLPAAGGTIEYLTPYDYATEAIAVSETNIYFNDWSSLYSVPIASPKQMTQLGSAGGGLMGLAYFNGLELVGDRLFWRDNGDNVGWTKTDGSQCGLLFSAESPNWVTDIAVAGDTVYVALQTTLVKLSL